MDFTTLLCTQQALAQCEPYLNQDGDLLPIRVGDSSAYYFHITNYIEAVDENTKWEAGYPGPITGWKDLAFKPELLTRPQIFTSPTLLRNRVFVSQHSDATGFFDSYRASGNTDLKLELVWEHESGN